MFDDLPPSPSGTVYPVTVLMPVEQFRRLMPVILDADCPDDLTNRVLVDVSPPRGGTVRFRITPEQARSLLALVRLWCEDEAEARRGMREVLATLKPQLTPHN